MADRSARNNGPDLLDSQAKLARAVHRLTEQEPLFASAVAACGIPELRSRPANFVGLTMIVAAQRVSLSAARSVQNRLLAASGGLDRLDASWFLTLNDEQARMTGLGMAKIASLRGVAQAIISRQFDLAELSSLPEDEAVTCLCRHRGIGPWTAYIYLMFCLHRADVWPRGDLALRRSYTRLATQTSHPTMAEPNDRELAEIAENWRPCRSAAAYLLWCYYSVLPVV